MVGNWLKFNNSPLVANMKIRRSAYDGLNTSKSLAPIFVDYDLCLGSECDFKILRFSFDEATFLSDSDLFPNNSTVILTINSVTWTNAQLRTLVNSLKSENPNTKTTLYDFIENIAKDSNLNNDEYAISFNNNGYVYSGKDLIAYLYIRNTKTSSNTDTTQIQLVNESFVNICSHIAGVSGGCAGEKFDSSLPKSNIAKYNDLPVMNNNCNPLNCGECHKNHVTADNALCLVECPVNAIKYKATNTVEIVSSTEYKDSLDINFKRKNFSSYASGISDSDFINVHTSNNVLKATFLTIYNYILSKASSLLTNNTLVKRDSSGNFKANIVTATINGDATGSTYSEKSNADNYHGPSPFKTVFVARKNGDNYDNHPDNYIKCTSATDTVLTVDFIPRDLVKYKDLSWGAFAFENNNISTPPDGDYNNMKKITAIDTDNLQITITGGGSNFVNKRLFFVCYDNIGTPVNDSSSILNKSSISTLFSLSPVLGSTEYVVFGGAFVNSDDKLVLLLYFRNGSNWNANYVIYDDETFSTVDSFGQCVSSPTDYIQAFGGNPLNVTDYIYFPVGGGLTTTQCRTLVYTKATSGWSIDFTSGGDLISQIPILSGGFWTYPNYIGFDGQYYYITAQCRYGSIPMDLGEVSDDKNGWLLCELRSTNPTSGFGDAVVITKSYDVWGCERHYPESTRTFKFKSEVYLAVSGTSFEVLSGVYANRSYAIYKRLGFGKYERDKRSPLIINPMYASSMAIPNWSASEQSDHIGAGITAVVWRGTPYLFYTATQGTSNYAVFAVEKPELIEENSI